MLIVDSHTHLDLLDDADAAVAAAVENAVGACITVGTSVGSTAQAIAISEKHHQHVRVAAGIHPNSAAGATQKDWEELCALATHPHVVAIGETGFDQYHKRATVEEQERIFIWHCELARELQLPLIIHSRDTDDITLQQLDAHAAGLDVILHCFAMETKVDEVLSRNYYCSFAGNVTYASATGLRAAVQRIPAERLMVETDAPYLTPVPFRGKPNSPALVRTTLDAIAEVRRITPETLAGQTTNVAVELFGLQSMAVAPAGGR